MLAAFTVPRASSSSRNPAPGNRNPADGYGLMNMGRRGGGGEGVRHDRRRLAQQGRAVAPIRRRAGPPDRAGIAVPVGEEFDIGLLSALQTGQPTIGGRSGRLG